MRGELCTGGRRRGRRGTAAALALVLLATEAAAARPKLVVLDLSGAGGVEPQTVSAFSQAVATAASARGLFDVISSQDVATLLGVERQRQLAGCSTESGSCVAELSGALGAGFVMSGTLARLGDAWQLTLSTLDATRAQPVGRSTRIAADLKELQAALPWAVAEATASPLPEAPSKAVPVGLLVTGAAAVVAGGIIGLQGLAQDSALGTELSNPRPGALDTRERYSQRAQPSATLKTVSLVMLIGGAALASTGAVLLWRVGTPSVSATLVPTGAGVAVVGELP